MTTPAEIQFKEVDLDAVASAPGKIAVFVDPDGKMDAGARKVNTLTRKALARFVESDGFEKMAVGDLSNIAYPAGLAAEAVCVLKMPRRPSSQEARKAGAQLAKVQGGKDLLVLAGTIARADEIALGLALFTVLALKAVGSLLMGALLVIPALTARLLAHSPKQMVIWAFVIAQIGVTVGLWSSAGLNTSTGLSIVLTMSILFALIFIAQKSKKLT